MNERIEAEARTAMVTESEMGHVCAYRMLERLQSKLNETHVAECSQCHNDRPCQLLVDPLVAQRVYAEYEGQPVVREWWCRPCFDYRAGDV